MSAENGLLEGLKEALSVIMQQDKLIYDVEEFGINIIT